MPIGIHRRQRDPVEEGAGVLFCFEAQLGISNCLSPADSSHRSTGEGTPVAPSVEARRRPSRIASLFLHLF